MDKIEHWDGQHKADSRKDKVGYVLYQQGLRHLPPAPSVLSFPGSCAHFERQLVGMGVTNASKINGIQRVSSPEEVRTLGQLLQSREQHKLTGMSVYPSTFERFVDRDRSSMATALRRGRPPSWSVHPTSRHEMENFQSQAPYDILDLDLCGSFSESIGCAITSLFSNHDLSDKGVLFINHLKGREKPASLLPFLSLYFRNNEHCSCNTSRLRNMDSGKWDYVRYVLVPGYYLCQAYDHGYLLTVDHLLEYRDVNAHSSKGGTMLQWHFRFERFAKSGRRSRPRQALRDQLKSLSKRAYKHVSAL